MGKLKELFNTVLPRNDSAHATMIAVIGGYLIYLAYQMVRDTLSDVSTMSMTTTVILAGLMALAGLAVIVYGVWIWRTASKGKKDGEEV